MKEGHEKYSESEMEVKERLPADWFQYLISSQILQQGNIQIIAWQYANYKLGHSEKNKRSYGYPNHFRGRLLVGISSGEEGGGGSWGDSEPSSRNHRSN